MAKAIEQLNDAQVEAITTRVPNVLVSAGAGSGKTKVLTQRYFHLLDDIVEGRKVRLDEILTLTFTRKAAQEMRERIAAKLEQEGRTHERRELARAPISTIHSFCESVLREHALQAGIDPNFRMLDDAESATLQENALDTVFEDLWEGTQQERDVIGRLILDVPQCRLRSGLLSIFHAARTRGLAIDALAIAPPLPLDAATAAFRTAVEELLALEGTPKWRENLRQAEAAFAALRPLLAQTGEVSWDTYDAVQHSLKALTPSGGPKELAKQARDAVKAAAAEWLAAYLEPLAHPYLEAFLTLLRRFATAYTQGKNAQGLLDFEDLLLITRDLLLHENGGAVERLRRKYRQIMVDEFQDTNPLQFSLIEALQGDGHLFMVGDVKQAIYRFIGSDIRVFLGQERRILGMDDDGQRIPMHINYRTRPEILEPLNGLFARLWPLDRVEDGFTFEPLSAGRAFADKAEPSIEMAFWLHDKETSAPELRDTEAKWIARRILQFTGKIDGRALQVSGKSEDGTPATRDARYGDIILLFRASSDVPLYEDALRCAGIPYYVVSGRGFYGTREVQDIMFLLRVLENPMDDFSLAVVLRSPLAGVSDDTLFWLSRDWSAWTDGQPYPKERTTGYGRFWANIVRAEALPPIAEADKATLIRFRDLCLDLQPEIAAGQPLDLIDTLLARTSYRNVLLAMDGGDQRYANVQKLREVAATFQGRGIFDLSDFQRYLTKLSEQAPREASAPLDVEGSNIVRLMTIHASKGLESPIIFLADCGREPNAVNDPFLFTPAGLTCTVPTPEDEWAKPASYQRAAEEMALADRREAERLLYVALTRAQEHLICSGFTRFPEPEKQVRYADILTGLLGLTGPVPDDTDLPVRFEETAYPIRVWSPASLQAVVALSPPAQSPTLWDLYADRILAGQGLPVQTSSEAVERFAGVIDRLQPLPPMRREGPVRIGVHRALCYNACPRQYWFRYVLDDDGHPLAPPPQIEEDGYTLLVEDDEQERLDGTEFGKLLHAVMQHIDFAHALPEQLPSILQRLAKETAVTAGDADQARLAEALHHFMALPIYPALQKATSVQRELRFLAHEGKVFVPGIIDALVEIDGGYWILDYKTGRPAADHLRQLALYALGVQHTLGVTPERLILIYPGEEGSRGMRDEALTPKLLDEARRLLTDAEEGINEKRFPPIPGRHCEFCVFAQACPQGQEALAVATGG